MSEQTAQGHVTWPKLIGEKRDATGRLWDKISAALKIFIVVFWLWRPKQFYGWFQTFGVTTQKKKLVNHLQDQNRTDYNSGHPKFPLHDKIRWISYNNYTNNSSVYRHEGLRWFYFS